jgi:Septum formation
MRSLTETDMFRGVNVVPCTTAHEGEVFAVFDLPAGAYPGDAAVDRQAGATCNQRYASVAPAAFADDAYGLFVITPLEAVWRTGDRRVVCIASSKPARTGSVLGR